MSKTRQQLNRIENQLSHGNLDLFSTVERIEHRLGELAKHVDSITNYLVDEKVEDLHIKGTADVLAHAIRTEQVVAFRYEREDGVEMLRIVSPWEVTQTATGPHMVGWDHGRQGPRQFALRRVIESEIQPSFEFAGKGGVYDPIEAQHAPFSGSIVCGDELVR